MKLTEELVESRQIYSGKIVTLKVDTVRLPNGKESTREIVVHNGAVTAVPMLDEDTIVMVRQFRLAAGEALLEIPAGTLEEGEKPEECASRELQEEIGYRPERLQLMFSSFLAPGYSSEKLFTYLATGLTESKQTHDEDEFLEVVHVGLDEAVALISQGQVKDAKTICGVLMAHRMLERSK